MRQHMQKTIYSSFNVFNFRSNANETTFQLCDNICRKRICNSLLFMFLLLGVRSDETTISTTRQVSRKTICSTFYVFSFRSTACKTIFSAMRQDKPKDNL